MLRKVKKGQKVFSQNDKSKEMYFIQSGEIRIHQIQNKKEIFLATLQKGELFGEMALIAGMHRTATAAAVEDTELNVITEDEFKSNTENVPSWYMTLLRVTCERLKQINEKLQVSGNQFISISNVSKLIAMILKKSQRDNALKQGSRQNCLQLDLKTVKHELIEILGIGISSLNEILEHLKENGMITILPNIIEVPDPDMLFQYSGYLKKTASNPNMELMPQELFTLIQNLKDLLDQKHSHDQIATRSYSEFKSDMAAGIRLNENKIEWFLNFCKTTGLIKFIFSDTTEAVNIASLDDNTQLQFQITRLTNVINEEKFKSMGN